MGAIRLEIPSDRHMVDLAEAVGVRLARIHGMAVSEAQDLGVAVWETVPTRSSTATGNRAPCGCRSSLRSPRATSRDGS